MNVHQLSYRTNRPLSEYGYRSTNGVYEMDGCKKSSNNRSDQTINHSSIGSNWSVKRLKRRIMQLIKPILPLTVTLSRHSRSNSNASSYNGKSNNHHEKSQNCVAAPVGGRLFRSTSTFIQRSTKVFENGTICIICGSFVVSDLICLV